MSDATVPMCPVVHFEMPYRDRDRAARFYAQAFGWTHQKLGPEMGDYLLVTTAPPGARAGLTPQASMGAIHGGFFPLGADASMQHPSVVIAVEDEPMAPVQAMWLPHTVSRLRKVLLDGDVQ